MYILYYNMYVILYDGFMWDAAKLIGASDGPRFFFLTANILLNVIRHGDSTTQNREPVSTLERHIAQHYRS